MRDYRMADAAAALELVRRSDHDRSRFLQSLSGGSWLDLSQYHLSIDTGAVSLDETVDLIARLVLRRRP
jgi:cytidylate kinase